MDARSAYLAYSSARDGHSPSGVALATASTLGRSLPLVPLPPPPPTIEEIDEAQSLLRRHDAVFIERLRRALGERFSEQQLEDALTKLRRIVEDPDGFVQTLEVKAGTYPTLATPPADFDGRLPGIEVDVMAQKYEPMADALGWAWHCLPGVLGQDLIKSGFVTHSAPEGSGSFIYEMQVGSQPVDGHSVRIALFADFGTGTFWSRYIAWHLRNSHALDYAFHLGDVYYAGSREEFKSNFDELLSPMLDATRFFAMLANHEMYAGAKTYFAYLLSKRAHRGAVQQEQDGSYFCVRSPWAQVIGLDTAYHRDGRFAQSHVQPQHNDKQREWLKRVLSFRSPDGSRPLNILLTPNEPYHLGKTRVEALYGDLAEHLPSIDWWFWGNTHYAAHFETAPHLVPFRGCCVGHAGHPIYLEDVERWSLADLAGAGAAKARWVDRTTRFPSPHDTLRPEMANHGFAILTLARRKGTLDFYDWRNHLHDGASVEVAVK